MEVDATSPPHADVPSGWEVVAAPKASSVPDGWEVVPTKAPAAPEGLIEHIKNWDQSGEAADDLKHVAIGALKQPGRLLQGITSPIYGGVAALTDKVYGLPSGASAQAMQPDNTAEKIGGYAADAAELVGAGAADAGMVYTRGAAGRFTNAPYMSTVAGRGAKIASDVGGSAVQAAKTAILGAGPVTATKIGTLVGKYGVQAMASAMSGLGLGAGWAAWNYLTKDKP